MDNLKIIAPWLTLYREIDALFGSDPDIRVDFDGDSYTIKLFVSGEDKAQALEAILPAYKEFGNVTAYINVIPDNSKERKVDLFRRAFANNPAVSYITSIKDPFQNQVDFIVFKKEVVQFFNDEMYDVHGFKSTLYQDIAKNLFEDSGVFFCTDAENKAIG